jgi:hypothetical protein
LEATSAAKNKRVVRSNRAKAFLLAAGWFSASEAGESFSKKKSLKKLLSSFRKNLMQQYNE